MMGLWLGLGLITLVVLGSLLLPLRQLRRQAGASTEASRTRLNVSLFRDRLDELQRERDAGVIEAAHYDSLKSELEQRLLGDVGDEVALNVRARSVSFWALVALIGLVLPLASLALYSHLGSPQTLEEALVIQETRQDVETADNLPQLLERLQTRLQRQPENIDGWMLLGRTRLSMQQYDEAAQAFERAGQLVEQRGENPAPAFGLQAQALFFKQERLTPEVQAAIDRALQFPGEESNALSLLGIDAFQRQDFSAAIGYWERVVKAHPQSPDVESLKAGIERAQTLLAMQQGTPPPIWTTQDPVASAGAGVSPDVPEGANGSGDPSMVAGPTSLRVTVTLDPGLAGTVEPTDTLFILARPANGQRMPLAVTRTVVAALPLSVTLDDSLAMGPMAKLSSVSEVEVVARVSRSGQPIPQAGDLEGVVGPITVGEAVPVTVEINRAL